jgi:hypothetical protein
MRLADTPAAARAGGEADSGTVVSNTGVGNTGVGNTGAGNTGAGNTAFAAAVAAFTAGREAVAAARDDLELEDWPAPKRLAPHAVALAATAYRDGTEAGSGRLVLLYDPAGQDGWAGNFRIVAQVHADVEEEMGADPLLGEVGWSWLTDALEVHAPGYAGASGTVTRVITEGYGSKADDPPSTAFELRASWSPANEELAEEISGAVAAWCALVAAAAGLPQQPGVTALNARLGSPDSRWHGGGRRRR